MKSYVPSTSPLGMRMPLTSWKRTAKSCVTSVTVIMFDKKVPTELCLLLVVHVVSNHITATLTADCV